MLIDQGLAQPSSKKYLPAFDGKKLWKPTNKKYGERTHSFKENVFNIFVPSQLKELCIQRREKM